MEHFHGVPVTVRCRSHSLSEIWYHFNVAGTIQTGKFVPAKPGSSVRISSGIYVNSLPDGQTSNCPARGIRYPPKREQNEPTKTTTGHSEPTATGIPFLGKGHMMVSRLNQQRGCIISYGTWFASGTCATFRAEKVSGKSYHFLSFSFFLCSLMLMSNYIRGCIHSYL